MDLINALLEFNKAVKYTAFITCADIRYTPATGIWELYDETPPPGKTIILKTSHSVEDYYKFLDELDFNYDRGYGTQELFGTVWMQDGSWFTRAEYDGSEQWVAHDRPKVPDHLI